MTEMPAVLRDAGVTRREAQVLEELGARASNAEIAEKLYVSVRTVESHVSSLLRKLGAADRFELWELARRLAGRGAGELPLPLVELAGRGPFVGRDREVARLHEAFVASQEQRRLVLVAGEAGIGKSRLVAEVSARLHNEGAAVLFGRCDEEALAPCQPFVEAVDPLIDHAPDAVVERVRPTLSSLLPRLGEGAGAPEPPADPEVARFRLFEAFDTLLSAAPSPTVLVVEDVHWADAPTLLLLRHLLRRADRSAMLVVATARQEGLAPGRDLAAELALLEAREPLNEVALSGLGTDDVRKLFGGRPGAEELAAAACRRTGGNPFLLHEILRHLDELPGHGGLDDSVPERVRDSVKRRVAALGAEVDEMLSAGAVMGEAFHFGVTARVMDARPEELLGALDHAVAAGLVVEDRGRPDWYRFAHALVRDALEQALTSSRMARLHLRIAEELEGAEWIAPVAEVAHHHHAALPAGDAARALSTAGRAAQEAMDVLAYERAADFHTMALDAVEAGGGDDSDRLDTLLARGDARLRAGSKESARADLLAAAALAEHIGDMRARARAALGVGETADIWGDDPELVRVLEAALVALKTDDVALRSRVRARLAQALYYSGPPDRRDQLSKVAVEEARASGEPEALAWVLSARHAALWGPTDLDARIEAAEEIGRLAAELDDDELAVLGLGWLAVDRLERGDRAAFDAAVSRHAELAGSLRRPLHLRDAEMWAVTRALLDGRLDDAEEGVERMRDLSEAVHDPHAETVSWVGRFWLAYEREDPATLDELAELWVALAARYPHVPAWRAALALLHARRGDAPKAREQFEPLAADDFAGVPRDVVYVNTLTFLAETCHFLGDAARARVLLTLLGPFSGRFALVDRAMYCKGSVDRYLGLLAATAGDEVAAERHLRAALSQHEEAHARLLAARTRRELTAISGPAAL